MCIVTQTFEGCMESGASGAYGISRRRGGTAWHAMYERWSEDDDSDF